MNTWDNWMTEPSPEHAPAHAIEIANLSKTYKGNGKQGSHRALDDISLTIPCGSFFGLLGPNGAGKSTLINILAGLVVKSSGTARIWGYDIESDMRQARRAIGIVPQELNMDPFFSPYELLDLQAGLYGVPRSERRTEEILDAVGLLDKRNAYARSLSGGMRRRLLVGKAMVHSPRVLVLDEPTAGVDVALRHQLWRYVRRLNEAGTTVLLTTHYLEEAEQLCDQIAIINHGALVANERTRDLVRRLDTKEISVSVDREVPAIPDRLLQYHVERTDERTLRFCYPPSRVRSGDILAAVNEAGFGVVDVTTREAELEDIFVSLTGSRADTSGDAA